MRRSVFALFVFSSAIGLFLCGCDLLDRDVLIDDGEKTLKADSTTIRELSNVPDSTHLVIETTASWHADVIKGGEWCILSKTDGGKGRDTIHIRVDENVGTTARDTWIVVESGTNIWSFKVRQRAGETWHAIPYWSRTAAQRLGLHGTVKQFVLTNNWYVNEASTFTFDSNGNLLTYKTTDLGANRYDTTRVFTYDEANHRLTCTVSEDLNSTVIRKWRYEYENPDKYVAYSAKGWNDPDPLAEDMEGMIVPDLSAVYKSWKDGDIEHHEDRKYLFEGDSRLVITIYRWDESGGDSIDVSRDTMRVSYQYFNSCKLTLPYTSRNNVTNTTYYSNGMLKMMKTTTGTYDYLDNVQRMVVISYAYNGASDAPHDIESYECEYNSNRDLVERRIRKRGSTSVTVEKYPQYEYDDKHNWIMQCEEIDEITKYMKREFVYYR